jgi:hypothetical protein
MSSDPILDSGDLAVRSPRPARRWPGRASPFMHLHPAPDHLAAIQGGHCRRLDLTLDEVFSAESPAAFLQEAFDRAPAAVLPPVPGSLVQSQEVWAAGVTYLRSMNARKEESKEAGGDTFYDRVYAADRPELFFKATPHRVAAPRAAVRIRSDSRWNVPEPELTLALDRKGRIFGYTVGNDMSSRDIEGENPLYLPQAKVYDGCAALGPALWVSAHPPGPGNRDQARDPPRWNGGLRRRDEDREDQTSADVAGRLPVPGKLLPARLLPHDRHGHHPPCGIHAAAR